MIRKNLYIYEYLKDLENPKTKSFIKKNDSKFHKYIDSNKDLYNSIEKDLRKIYSKKTFRKYNFYIFRDIKVWIESTINSTYIVSQYKKEKSKRILDLTKGKLKNIYRYEILEDIYKLAIFTNSSNYYTLYIYDLISGELDRSIELVPYEWSIFYKNQLYYIKYKKNKRFLFLNLLKTGSREKKVYEIPNDLLISHIYISNEIFFIEHIEKGNIFLSIINLNNLEYGIKNLFSKVPDKYKILTHNKSTYIFVNKILYRLDVSSWENVTMISIIDKYNIEDIFLSKEYIVAIIYNNFKRSIIIFDYTFKFICQKDFGGEFKKISIQSNTKYNTIYITEEGLILPPSTYKYDIKKDELNLVYKIKLSKEFNTSLYQVKKIFYKNKDNLKIPIILIYNKKIKLKGKNPLIFNIYGGFRKRLDFTFLQEYLLFLNKGGIYAIASVRGDGDLEDIYKIKNPDKCETIEDILSCSKFLIKENYTDNHKFILKGTSNGGMMALSAMLKNPYMYKAIISKSPVTNIIDKYPSYIIEKEFGVLNRNNYNKIIKWNPIDNVNIKIRYPDILFIVNLKDKVVFPYHSLIFIKKLSEKSINYIIFNENEGHIPYTGTLSFKEGVKMFTFIFNELGIT